jgi:uncharacterized protein
MATGMKKAKRGETGILTEQKMRREDLLDMNEAVQNPGKKLVFDVKTELPQEEDLDLVEPVEAHIEAVSTGNLLLVNGSFQTKCVLECARCGAPLSIALDYEMDDHFPVEGVPSCYASDGYAKVVPDDEPYPIFHNNALKRDTWIRQGLLINIPVQPLCSFGWDGPCPNAEGVDRSKEGSKGNPAFESLANLRLPEDEG